jgi:hypothetical protein
MTVISIPSQICVGFFCSQIEIFTFAKDRTLRICRISDPLTRTSRPTRKCSPLSRPPYYKARRNQPNGILFPKNDSVSLPRWVQVRNINIDHIRRLSDFLPWNSSFCFLPNLHTPPQFHWNKCPFCMGTYVSVHSQLTINYLPMHLMSMRKIQIYKWKIKYYFILLNISKWTKHMPVLIFGRTFIIYCMRKEKQIQN